jgi:hypothetical protein
VTVPTQLRVTGATKIGPIQPTSAPFPSGEAVYSLNFEETVQENLCRTFSVNSPSPAFFDLLASSGIASLRYIYIRARVGAFVVRVTSSAGVDQLFDLSRLLVLSNPQPGTEWTALAIQGVGDIEVQLAGDP